MKRNTAILEIAFEKNCSMKKAAEIYETYRKQNRLKELYSKLKEHKEV